MNPLVFHEYSKLLCDEFGANYMIGTKFIRTGNAFEVEYLSIDTDAVLYVDSGMAWLVDYEKGGRIPFSLMELGKAFKLYTLLEIDRIAGSEESHDDLVSFAKRNDIPCIW